MSENKETTTYPAALLNFRSGYLENIILYRKYFADFGYTIIMKPFSLRRDITRLHHWVNSPYALEFWQMQGTIPQLYKHYEQFLQSGNGYSFLFFIGKKPVGLIDFYYALSDEIKTHYNAGINDYGIHVLMAPPGKKVIRGLSVNMVITCLYYLFTLSVERIIGEPDIKNEKANRLVKRVGFRLIKEVQLSYKKANLYWYDKTDFQKEHTE
jgi:RimJ/RimL family protein N-acetyltransferase